MKHPLLLVGSHAARFHHPIDHRSYGQDYDLVGYYDDLVEYFKSKHGLRSLIPISQGKKLVAKYQNSQIFEAEIVWPDSSAEDLYETAMADDDTQGYDIRSSQMFVPSFNFLYMLKMSHRYLKNSPHFHKTMADIKMMRNLGAEIDPIHMDFYRRREIATYNYGHPKLNVSKSRFFNGDGVDYKYDHDSIHRSVMRGYQPAYEVYKEDEADVFCSRELFYAAPQQIRLHGVLEESMVLALERSQIPFPGMKTPLESFLMALEKVCTSITSGWFREFAWDHYDAVVELYDPNYVNQFWEDVKSGVVTPYVGQPAMA